MKETFDRENSEKVGSVDTMRYGECKVGMLVAPFQPTVAQFERAKKDSAFARMLEWRSGRIGIVCKVYTTERIKVRVKYVRSGPRKDQRKEKFNKAYVFWFCDQKHQWINTQFLQEVT